MLNIQRRHILFLVVSLALLMSSIDFTIVAVALDAIRTELHASIVWTGWTVTAYSLGQLLILPIAGAMSDEFGRKRVFLGSLAIFTVSSLLCGLAPNIQVLVFFRALQAIGGGAFLPSCTGIVSEEFGDNRVQAIGLFSGISPIGTIIGPNLGGLLVVALSWRYVFWVNVPIGVLVLLLTWLLYRQRSSPTPQRIDYVGVLCGGTAIVAALFALTWVGQYPNELRNPLLWLAFIFAGVMLVLFWRWEHRVQHPIIEPALLKERPFLAANLYNLFYGVGAFGFSAFVATYIQGAYNTSAAVAGALLTPRALSMIITSTIASVFIIRMGYRLPMLLGLLLQALNLAMLSGGFHNPQVFGISINSFVWLGIIMVISGIAFGVSQPASQNAVLDLVPERVASVTGIRQMFRNTGGVFGTALIVLVLQHYNGREALGFQRIYFALALMYLLIIPTVFMIPDTARQRRRAAAVLASSDAAAEPAEAG
jgi:EmrB/QacA subfamily drug resistance transporter